MAADSNTDRKVRNEVEATGGTKRPGLIYVLGASVVLVLVAFAVVWAFQSH